MWFYEEQQRPGRQQDFMKRCSFVTHLHIIYKGLVADTKSLLAFDDCWIPDGQNKLLASLANCRSILSNEHLTNRCQGHLPMASCCIA